MLTVVLRIVWVSPLAGSTIELCSTKCQVFRVLSNTICIADFYAFPSGFGTDLGRQAAWAGGPKGGEGWGPIWSPICNQIQALMSLSKTGTARLTNLAFTNIGCMDGRCEILSLCIHGLWGRGGLSG